MLNNLNWTDILQQISLEILSDPDFINGNLTDMITPEQRQAKWLGAPSATEKDLLDLEQRLQTTLPPSYRAFLRVSDGFGPIDYFIWRLRPFREVDWLVNTDADFVKLWESNIESIPSVPDEEYFRYDDEQIAEQVRSEYFRNALMVSDWGDAGFIALNPSVQHEGEWEAWHFANWIPGAFRYKSFAELINGCFKGYKQVRYGH